MITQPAGNREIISIPRPEKDQAVKSVPVKVQMNYRGVVLTEEIVLRIGQKELTDGEKLVLLRGFRKSLGKMILGSAARHGIARKHDSASVKRRFMRIIRSQS
jgi:hypothetical protein